MQPREEANAIVAGYAALIGVGHDSPTPALTEPKKGGVALILAPHPDDEVMMAGLPLRLQREAGMPIRVAPMTLGSAVERREARRQEMIASCARLGFGLIDHAAPPFDALRPAMEREQATLWATMADRLAALLQTEKPDILFLPHRHDCHPAHIGVHNLAMAALERLAADSTMLLAFTEFWQAQTDPNLLVESSVAEVTTMVTALMAHEGEIARTPYHRRLPAWMIDNARRGEERIGRFGIGLAHTGFATLYHLTRWQDGLCRPIARPLMLRNGMTATIVLE